MGDAAARNAQIDGALGELTLYADPRTDAPITDATALKTYVGMFSEMAPGMPVSVAGVSTVLHFARATVLFGEGDHAQSGQYAIDLDANGKITRMIGFKGVGDSPL